MRANPRSTYFTFRIISANSPADSWIRKAVPANDVAKAIENATRNDVENLIHEGLSEDLGL